MDDRSLDESAQAREPAAASLRRIAAADPARPFVVAQLGQSLDGRIATRSGESRYINGAGGLDHLHRLRASVDATLVGAGTIRADDPQLTVRRCLGSNPARVIIDPHGRLDAYGRWLADDGARRVLIAAVRRPAPPGVETLVLPAADGAIAPGAIVAALHGIGISRLLVEGGAKTISAFVDAGVVDRLHLIVSCTIIGSGRSGLDLQPLNRLCDALKPKTDIYRLDDRDILFDCDLRTAEGERADEG